MRIFKYTKQMLVIIAVICLLAFPARAAEEPFEMHLLDVGQGQSVLIQADGRSMLIDGGGRSASSYVVSYLKRQGIEKLDYIVVSHYDEDHISGVVGALHVFGCDTILAPDYTADTDIYASYLQAAEDSGAKIIYPEQGETYTLGGAQITVVGPASYENELENDRSVAVRITYGMISCLICGDAQEQEEWDMMDSGLELESDIYVVNHHGSADSSGYYFLCEVRPACALLSCGAGNAYGHPAEETMQRLCDQGISVYRTDRQGAVIACSDGSGLWFNQEPCDDFSPGGQQEKNPQTENPAAEEAPAIGELAAGESSGTITYVCNLNTHKFHYEYCDSVNQMKESNKKYTQEDRDSLVAQGYVPCKNCCP